VNPTRIYNAKDRPLNALSGTVPNVSGALRDYFQAMTFGLVSKDVVGGDVVETKSDVTFQGVIQPLSGQRLLMKPEGQRKWTWWLLHSDITLDLGIDEVVTYLGTQYRVMAKKNFDLYGYREWELINDYTGAGPA
jgi:hypothetical protein